MLDGYKLHRLVPGTALVLAKDTLKSDDANFQLDFRTRDGDLDSYEQLHSVNSFGCCCSSDKCCGARGRVLSGARSEQDDTVPVTADSGGFSGCSTFMNCDWHEVAAFCAE